MGGIARFVDNGGIFMVHMFTFTGNRTALRSSLDRDTAGTVGQVEQQSALLASADNDFLIRMGVSRLLLTEVMYRQSAVQSADQPLDSPLPHPGRGQPLQRRDRRLAGRDRAAGTGRAGEREPPQPPPELSTAGVTPCQ